MFQQPDCLFADKGVKLLLNQQTLLGGVVWGSGERLLVWLQHEVYPVPCTVSSPELSQINSVYDNLAFLLMVGLSFE